MAHISYKKITSCYKSGCQKIQIFEEKKQHPFINIMSICLWKSIFSQKYLPKVYLYTILVIYPAPKRSP